MKQIFSVGVIQLLVILGIVLLTPVWIDGYLYPGFNIPYLLVAECEELRLFYPNYYMIIWAIARFVRIVLPFSIVVILISWPSLRSSFIRILIRIWFSKESLLLAIVKPVLAALTISVLTYIMIRELVDFPFNFQQSLARSFLCVSLGHFLMVAAVRFDEVKTIVREFLFESVQPYSLAITRIVFFLILSSFYLGSLFSGNPTIGEFEMVPLPGIGWLIEVLPVSIQLYAFLCILGIFFSVMIMIGYRTRVFLLLNAMVVFYVVAVPNFYGKLWHQQIIIWISWILALSPCADVLSLDARSNRTIVTGKVSYAFHLRIIWLHFGIIYFFAGFHKLWVSGFDWALHDTVVNIMTIEWFEHYDNIPTIRIDRIPSLVKAGALITVLFEIVYVFLLFSKRWRWGSIIGGLTMHNLLGYFMYISFFSTLQIFYVVFMPWNKLIEKIGLQSFEKSKVSPPKLDLQLWIVVPTLIFVANFLCGVFRVNSYPFSVYPVYTDIVPASVSYLDYEILDKGFESMDFREEGKRHTFNWEDYSRLEYQVITDYTEGAGLDSLFVRKQWRRWQLEVESLSNIDSVNVHVKRRWVSPDSINGTIDSKYLMSIYR